MAQHLYIITGTTKGLGAALLKCLAAVPSNTLVALSRFAASESGKLVAQSGVWGINGSNANIHADFANLDSLPAMCAQVEAHLVGQHFDRAVLINNAGVVLPVGRFDALDPLQLSNHFHVNVTAPMLLSGWFARTFRARARSRMVVNVSSGAAKRAVAGWSAYCTAKAALEMATRVAALEASADDPGLTICSLAPGVVDTPMQAIVRETALADFPEGERFRAMKADGLLRSADDVAAEIVALLNTAEFVRLARQDINLDIRHLNGR